MASVLPAGVFKRLVNGIPVAIGARGCRLGQQDVRDGAVDDGDRCHGHDVDDGQQETPDDIAEALQERLFYV